MSITYNDALNRLKEERHRLSLSQKEMAQAVHITQSNYSKVEQALRRLSYYELLYLCDKDVDVHYIFTAQRGNTNYSELLENSSYSEAFCYLKIIYSIAVVRSRQESNSRWKNIYTKLRYVSLLEDNQHVENIWLALRRSMNWQQQKMADKLGVDIKKLRDLENGRNLPDSELLCRLYEGFGIPPSVILKDTDGILSEVSILLSMMDEVSEKRICEIFRLLKD